MKIEIIPSYYKQNEIICCKWEFVGYSDLSEGQGNSCKEAFLDLIKKYKLPVMVFDDEQIQWWREEKYENRRN